MSDGRGWRGESQLAGELAAQELSGLVQPHARLTVDPATPPVPTEQSTGATAGPAPAPPVHRMVHQDHVEGGDGLARDSADPTRRATSRLHRLHQQAAQHRAHVLVSSLINAWVKTDRPPKHPALASVAADALSIRLGRPLSVASLWTGQGSNQPVGATEAAAVGLQAKTRPAGRSHRRGKLSSPAKGSAPSGTRLIW